MFWLYWDTAWSVILSGTMFATIIAHSDALVSETCGASGDVRIAMAGKLRHHRDQRHLGEVEPPYPTDCRAIVKATIEGRLPRGIGIAQLRVLRWAEGLRIRRAERHQS